MGKRGGRRGEYRERLRVEACPKCGGQYWRERDECQCWMCCFSWSVWEPLGRVQARAARKVMGIDLLEKALLGEEARA